MIFLQFLSSSPNAAPSNKIKKPVIQILYTDNEETKAQKHEMVCLSHQQGDGGGGRFSASHVTIPSFPLGSLACLWAHEGIIGTSVSELTHVSESEPLRCASGHLLFR